MIRSIGLVFCFAVLSACACVPSVKVVAPISVPEVLPGILQGYLALSEAPDSDVLLPKPPSADSVAFAADQEMYQKTRSLKKTPRWALAASDANLEFPDAAGHFACAAGVDMNPTDTPHMYMLLRRTLSDAGYATYKAKIHYQRPRPFMVHAEPSCKPEDEDSLRRDGSYPSGHAAIGWTWALILSELVPVRADIILKRGYAFGQSRVICGAHWQSDVQAGLIIAAAVVAKLQADPVFRAQMEAAKKELNSSRVRALKPAVCADQDTALAYDRAF